MCSEKWFPAVASRAWYNESRKSFFSCAKRKKGEKTRKKKRLIRMSKMIVFKYPLALALFPLYILSLQSREYKDSREPLSGKHPSDSKPVKACRTAKAI